MTVYEPGTVAVATVRGVPNVRIFRSQGDWISGDTVSGAFWVGDDKVTDLRLLVVLDLDAALDHMSGAKASLPHVLGDMREGGGIFAAKVADQIEAQTKPPRIPEPGLWGVVEAGHKHLGPERRSEFVRVYTEGVVQWVDRSSEADWCLWNDLIDPTPIRDGIEDGAK